MAALREPAAGRADLLVQVAGILEGASEGRLDEPLSRQTAQLRRDAGAYPDAIPAWIEEGRRRAASAQATACRSFRQRGAASLALDYQGYVCSGQPSGAAGWSRK